MEDRLKRLPNESKLDHIKRLTYGKLIDKTIDEDYIELAPLIFNQELSSCECRKRMYGVKYLLEELDKEQVNNISDNEILNKLEEKELNIQLDMKKRQAMSNEMNRRLRDFARIDLFLEKIDNAIHNIKPLETPQFKEVLHGKKDGIITIADLHRGKHIKLKDLLGNVINEYNTKISEQRMWNYLNQAKDIIEKEQLSHVNVCLLGDMIENILRNNSLNLLNEGVVDSIINVSEFLAQWINKLSELVRIDVYSAFGNHDTLRILNFDKYDLPEENIGKIIDRFIKIRLENNPRIIVHDNQLPHAIFESNGETVFLTHGEEKNLSQAIKDYKQNYGIDMTLVLAGHLHNKSSVTVSKDVECHRIPSICGNDEYSARLRKSGGAGGVIFITEENKGKTVEYTIKLN